MAEKVKIWFDKDGDFLEVLFSDKPGYMRETANDSVMERVDESGQLLGFSIMNVSQVASTTPLSAELRGKKPAAWGKKQAHQTKKPMSESIKLLDVVAVTEDVPAEKLRRGEVGTVVEVFESGVFEVEFADEDAQTYAMTTLRKDQLMVLPGRCPLSHHPHHHLWQIRFVKRGLRFKSLLRLSFFLHKSFILRYFLSILGANLSLFLLMHVKVQDDVMGQG
jgi:hypothetical protein